MELLAAIENSGFGIWVRESGSLWSYPTIIFLHSLGLSFVVGMSVALDLRLLGCAPQLPLAPLRRLFPIMWTGFWINAVSGVALLIADASTMAANPVFYVKMACIVGAVATMVLIERTVFGAGRRLEAGTGVGIAQSFDSHVQLCDGTTGQALQIATIAHSPSETVTALSSASARATTMAKVLAVASLLLWAGAITAGRLTAYLGPVAGLKGQ